MSSPETQPKAAQNQRLRALDAEAELERARSALAAVKSELSAERIAHAATESDLAKERDSYKELLKQYEGSQRFEDAADELQRTKAHAEACHAQAAGLAAALREIVRLDGLNPIWTPTRIAQAALAAYDNPAKRDEKEQKQ